MSHLCPHTTNVISVGERRGCVHVLSLLLALLTGKMLLCPMWNSDSTSMHICSLESYADLNVSGCVWCLGRCVVQLVLLSCAHRTCKHQRQTRLLQHKRWHRSPASAPVSSPIMTSQHALSMLWFIGLADRACVSLGQNLLLFSP